MKQHSEKFLKQRKFLLVLPVLVVPFLTMAFWAAGGGKGKTATIISAKQGLNPRLPDARLKDDRGLNKLSFYELAQKDSLRLKTARENDRDYLEDQNDSNKYALSQLKSLAGKYADRHHQQDVTTDDALQHSPGTAVSRSKSAEENLKKKLSRLEEEINKTDNENGHYAGNQRQLKSYRGRDERNPDIDRLEDMMRVMNNSGTDNPEMKQLDTMLEKILDLQHPERVRDKLNEKNKQHKKEVMPVKRSEQINTVSLLGSDRTVNDDAGFYGIGNAIHVDTGAQNAIEAVVHETQTLVSGAVVKLRLLSDIIINGDLISKDNFVYGLAKLSGERLTIEINSVTYNNVIYPVNLEVYDLDGLAGLYIPGAITRDVAKQSANSSVQSMGMTTLDPSLAAQATTASINAAKDLFSKKIKVTRVTVKAGYKVLLKIDQ